VTGAYMENNVVEIRIQNSYVEPGFPLTLTAWDHICNFSNTIAS
jgi:hypothetical protein